MSSKKSLAMALQSPVWSGPLILLWPHLPILLYLFHFSYMGPLTVLKTCHIHCHLRSFAQATCCVWNTFFPGHCRTCFLISFRSLRSIILVRTFLIILLKIAYRYSCTLPPFRTLYSLFWFSCIYAVFCFGF